MSKAAADGKTLSLQAALDDAMTALIKVFNGEDEYVSYLSANGFYHLRFIQKNRDLVEKLINAYRKNGKLSAREKVEFFAMGVPFDIKTLAAIDGAMWDDLMTLEVQPLAKVKPQIVGRKDGKPIVIDDRDLNTLAEFLKHFKWKFANDIPTLILRFFFKGFAMLERERSNNNKANLGLFLEPLWFISMVAMFLTVFFAGILTFAITGIAQFVTMLIMVAVMLAQHMGSWLRIYNFPPITLRFSHKRLDPNSRGVVSKCFLIAEPVAWLFAPVSIIIFYFCCRSKIFRWMFLLCLISRSRFRFGTWDIWHFGKKFLTQYGRAAARTPS